MLKTGEPQEAIGVRELTTGPIERKLTEAVTVKRRLLHWGDSGPPMARVLRFGVTALFLAGLISLGSRGMGDLPPLGPLLDPVHGVWSTAAVNLPAVAELPIPGLTAPVEVRVDSRGVPHIFAATVADAYRAQGYLVARDRLFQMEAQVRSAAGRLSEWAGARAVEGDRRTRGLGLPWAAERDWAALDTSGSTWQAVTAYAEGVNAWIDQLGARTLPFEYRLLQAWPLRWEPKFTLYFMAEMGRTLAFSSSELRRPRIVDLIGVEATEALFPVHAPIQEPVQPAPWPTPRMALPVLPPPSPSRVLAAGPHPVLPGLPEWGDDRVGSNNWAVAPGRTRDGHALLAGDPHLQLTLPSIWYEVHLIVPDSLDVAGVTFAGAPGVVIGFNRDVAWTFTNGGSDVLDWYRERVEPGESPTRYWLDGAWRDLTLEPTTYRGPGGELLRVDTLRRTHRGPMLRIEGGWYSLRWTVHDPADDLGTFLRIQTARSVEEWLGAMDSFVAPIQNGLVADRSGTIAIRASGRYPVRPNGARGDTIQDGTSSAHDWSGFLSAEHTPFARSPRQGFLASANQEPVDPRVDSAYRGALWPAPWRAMRINALLQRDSSVTPEAMRRFQTDPGSARVEELLPRILAAGGRPDSPDSVARGVLDRLREWDGRYTLTTMGAVLFEAVVDEVTDRLWDELVPPGGTNRIATPDGSLLLAALDDPGSIWWDARHTPEREDRESVVGASLTAAWQRVIDERGPPGPRWEWREVQHANLFHLLGLPALSELNLPVTSGPSTLAPSFGRGTHGASWRMVVELGPEVRAWGTYPGGQSGSPASVRYADRVPQWQRGELDTILFPREAGDLRPGQVEFRLTFRPVEGRVP